MSYGELHAQMLEQFAPPSIVVNEDYDIVHVSDQAGRFLQVAGGELSPNLLKLIRPELRLELRTALYQAVQRRTNVEVKNLLVRVGDRVETISLLVRPVLREGDAAHGFVLVLFAPSTGESDAETVVASGEPLVQQLEEEVIRFKAQLRTSSEQHDVQDEELRGANEELQALNEELRSAAEELETSKEELQSINEELRTVNQELKIKVEEITLARNNLQNLINSTAVGTVFLDRALRVALFTPAAHAIFNLIADDYGRPLSDITHRLLQVDVVADAEIVLATLQPIEREVQTTDERDFLMRLLPYRTADDRIGGVVVTFMDITERKRAEEALRRSEEKYRGLFVAMDEGYCIIQMIYDAVGKPVDFLYVDVNPAFEKQNGLTGATGKTIRELAPDIEPKWAEIYGRVADTGESLRFEEHSPTLDGRTFDLYAFRVGAPDERTVAVLFTDITARKQNEWQQAFLLQLNDALHSESDAVEIQAAVTGTTMEYFGADRCYYGEIEDNTSIIRRDALRGDVPSVAGVYPLEDFPLFKKMMNNGVPLVVQDSHTTDVMDEELKKLCVQMQVISFINVPIIKNNRYVGNLCITQSTPRSWADVEVKLAQEIAERTWAAVERARAEAAEREASERLRITIEAAAMGTWDWNLTTNTVNWNERNFELFGMEPTSGPVNPDVFFAHVHPDDRARVTEQLQIAVDQLRIFDAEFCIVREDGVVRWMSGYGQVVEVANGKGTRMSGVMLDITERKQAEAALQQANEALETRVQERTADLQRLTTIRQDLLRQLVSVQEEERRRISRELHDQMGQSLSALRLGLATLTATPSDAIARLQAIAAQIDADVDRLALELRPSVLDGLGLVAAVEQHVAEWSQRQQVTADFQVVGPDGNRLAPEIEVVLYRVTQEALTNILKHSDATQVSVILEQRHDQVGLVIEDNGRGFDADAMQARTTTDRRLGLLGMHERVTQVGGTLTIESAPGEGTTLYVRVPLMLTSAVRDEDEPNHASQ